MRLYVSSLLLICTFALQICTAQEKNATPSVKIYGDVARPLTLHAEDLKKMKHSTVTLKDHDGMEHEYSGVAIRNILELAGVTTGNELRGKNLSKYLLAKCADGYKVLFSLAELDSSFTDRIVVLADEMDGGPLPDGKGPFRLVVPGEKRPARSSFQVMELVVRSAGE